MPGAGAPPPATPAWPVRGVNAVFAGLQAMGLPLLRFEPAALLRLAQRRLGTELGLESGPEREGFERLCRSLEDDAGLSLVGRVGLREHVVGAMTSRLALEGIRRREPERLRWQGPPPLVIVGLPRSGTTLLHRLLARIPGQRALPLWQVRYPLPTPGKDRRVDKAAEQVRAMRSIAPVLDTKHPIGPSEPEECGFLLDPSFLSIGFWIFAPVYGYLDWLIEQDLEPGYRCWVELLALLQSEEPSQRLVLKAPTHCGYLPQLIAAMPGARLVQLERAPETIAVSMSSLFHSFHAMMSAAPDPARLGEHNLRLLEAWMRSNTAARDGLGERLLRLSYEELTADPLAAARRVHQHHGLGWDPAWEPELQAWIEAHPQDAGGEHHYTAETFGFEPDGLRQRLRGWSSGPPASGGSADTRR